jgi:NADPH:quinone reductase-like Zn-dependent oxidoreductase
VTAGTDQKCARCIEFGASAAINYNTEDFAARTRELTNGEGVDVILDCVGGSYLEANLQTLKVDGALVVIGLTGGASGTLHMGLLLTRRLRVIGSTLRTRPAAEKAAIVTGFEARFGAALAAGRLQVPIEKVFPLERAADAHRLVASSTHFGKVILTV